MSVCIRLALALIVLIPACSRTTPAAPSGNQLAPRQVLQQLIAHRKAREYPEMMPLIVAGQSRNVVSTLVSIDDFLGANERLRIIVRDRVGSGLADALDQSALGSRLEIFSRAVELHDEKITDDVALVGFVANEELPLRQARLVRTPTGWRYDPGTGGDARVGEAFGQLSRALDQCAEELKSGRIPADNLNTDPGPLLRDLQTRMSTGLRTLRQLAADAPPER